MSGPSFRFNEEAFDGVLPVMKKIADELGRIPAADMLGSQHTPRQVA